MGKREEIYTVHVKCRPDPSQNYPSERAYSSSTVGGLALTHLTLGAVGTTLYSVTYYNFGRYLLVMSDLLGSVLLVTGCILTFVTGILASRRWYVDRYIRWYLTACLISTASAFLTAIITIYGLALPDQPDPWTVYMRLNETSTDEPYQNYYQRELHMHILLAAALETLISLLSVKISWKGIRNRGPGKPQLPVRTDGDGYDPSVVSRPDIIENHDSNYTNVIRELYKLQKSSIFVQDELGSKVISKFYAVDPTGLPQPESQREYRERMEKFLASNDGSDKDSQIQ